MAEGNILEVGFLNVVATPHPKGVYAESLAEIAAKPIRYRGKDYAVVLPHKRNKKDPTILEGLISVWTDIDASEPSIDKATFEEKNVEDSLKKIFAQRGFNNRQFLYAFDEETHTLAVELLNDLGKRLSVRQASKIFEVLFSSLNRGNQTFEVTVKPEEDALEWVLGLKRLDRITILLKRPNPGDHHGDDADDVLRELDEQNLKQAEYDFARQPKTDGIHLNDKNQTRAEVASENGYVKSSGLDDYEERDKRSTKEYPKIVRDVLATGTLFKSAIRKHAKRYRGKK